EGLFPIRICVSRCLFAPIHWVEYETMAEAVAILEDDPTRIAAMRACLAAVFPGIEVIVFEDAREMIGWLDRHLGDVLFVSLDHDLPLKSQRPSVIDCGTGRQVADYLASLPPTCPVIVHSSNNFCAPGMFFALKDAGWPCSRVYPDDDQAWVSASWAEEVRRFVRDGWIKFRYTAGRLHRERGAPMLPSEHACPLVNWMPT